MVYEIRSNYLSCWSFKTQNQPSFSKKIMSKRRRSQSIVNFVGEVYRRAQGADRLVIGNKQS